MGGEKSKKIDEVSNVRLHIGNISKAVDADTLNKRLEKYGRIVEPVEFHEKPTLDNRFGYITLELSPQQLSKLKSAYHGVMFKGSKITINPARAKYTERLKEDQKNSDALRLSSDQLKRLHSRLPREINEIYGRHRQSVRKDLRHMTVRVIKRGGRVAKVHCSRKKLWGVNKDKTVDNLVWEYVNGQWKDGNGEVVETTDLKGLLADDGEGNNEEKDRNMQILNEMFKDEGEPMTGVDVFDEDAAGEEPPDSLKGLFGAEEDSTHNNNNNNAGFSLAMQLDDDDINTENAFEDVPDIVTQPPTNDNDNEKDVATTDTTNEQYQQTVIPRGLFFAHKDSPFLSSQSRLASLPVENTLFDPETWKSEFWEQRGAWNRSFQRRRRDVLRRRKTSKRQHTTAV